MNEKKREKEDRLLPQAEIIEEYVLGNIMTNPDCLYIFMKISKGENIFYTNQHQKIYEAILKLYSEGKDVDIMTVTNELSKINELENVGGAYRITQLAGMSTPSYASMFLSQNISAHTNILVEKYILRFLIDVFQKGSDDCFLQKDYPEIIESLHVKLDELEKFFEQDNSKTMHEALDMFLMSITDKSSGKVKNFYKTGFAKFDEVIALRPRMTMTIIGTEGCGKSKFARTLGKGLLKNNPELALLIISGEESFDEVISDMISEKVKLSKREIGGVNYTLSEEDIQTIKKSTDGLKSHNIEVYDRSLNVIKLKNLVKKFVKKHGSQCVIIVDNLGCIDSSQKFTGETEKDNYVSGTIRKLRDETNGCFIVIHHLTKEADSDKRLKEAYRPRKDLARGSKKIIDDSNVALLVNFPSIYPDLLREEKSKWKKSAGIEDIELTEDNYNEHLWKLNPAGDKNTENCDPMTSGWRVARDVCENKRTMDGNDISLGFLKIKYMEYLDYYKRVQEVREERYRKEKLSIYSFLIKGKYNESFTSDRSDRDNYLYGNSDQNTGIIEQLFIVDPAKVRDGGKGEILRYLADLKFSKFKEWNV